MKRGDIYWANLKPRSGSEQTGHRPVIIISHDIFNSTDKWRSIIIVPMSISQKQLKRGPTVIHLAKNETNLKQDSYILCHQVTTLDRSKLTRYIGTLSAHTLKELEQGLCIALGINNLRIIM